MRGMPEGRRGMGAPPHVPVLRPRGLLRPVEGQACHEALSSVAASHDAEFPAGRGLGVLLRGRPDVRAGAEGGAGETVTQVDEWPDVPLASWVETKDTLHLWTQVVGKVRLALAPRVNHWWHVPLYVN